VIAVVRIIRRMYLCPAAQAKIKAGRWVIYIVVYLLMKDNRITSCCVKLLLEIYLAIDKCNSAFSAKRLL